MKFNIKLNGVSVSRDIPNAWHLVTYRQFLELSKAGDEIEKIISVFTGIDADLIKKASIKNFDVLLSCLSFMKKEMNLIMPSTILDIKVPKSIEDEAAARYGDTQEIIKTFEKDTKENLKHFPLIVATYLTPSPYNFKEAEQIAEKLWEAPCVEVLAVGNFTLARLAASRNGMLKTYLREDTRLNRLRLAIRNWLTRSAFSIRYGIWKAKLPSPVRKYLNGL